MTKTDVIRKIQALLAKAGDKAAAENEIETAYNMARKLMTSYHLREEDLAHEPKDDYKKVDEADFGRVRSFLGKTVATWEARLATVISEFVGVPAYCDNDLHLVKKNGFCSFDKNDDPLYGKSIVFYGVAEDANIASELFDEMRVLIASMAVGRTGKIYKAEGASYCQGFVSSLYDKIKRAALLEMKDVPTTTALIVLRSRDLIEYKKEKAKEWLSETSSVKLRKTKRAGSKVGFDREAYQQGRVDGEAAELAANRRKKLQ